MSFWLSSKLDGDFLEVAASGFIVQREQAEGAMAEIMALLTPLAQQPLRVLFDLRGLKALSPEAVDLLRELEGFLAGSSFRKVGTVFDNLVTMMQHLRVIGQVEQGIVWFKDGRSRFFEDMEACRAWLMDDKDPTEK